MNLFEIANDLGILYTAREQLSLREWQINQDLAARKLYLTPAEGWPGKNAEQRDLEAARCFANDEPIQQMIIALADLKEDQSIDNGDILSLEAERRALEWSIRERLADALAGKGDGQDEFDEAEQAAVDEAISVQALQPVDSPDDDLPF